jgi:hypothetical protein
VTIPAPTATGVPQVLTYEFKRDLNGYLARLPASAPMDTLADVIAYNDAHPEEALKFGQTQLVASQAVDLAPDSAETVAYEANLAAGKAANRAAIDDALTRGTADPADDLEAIMTPAQTLIAIGGRAGYPQLTVPAGYDLDNTKTYNPVNVSFTGTGGSDAKLLAFGYAYEQATDLRLPPSQTNRACGGACRGARSRRARARPASRRTRRRWPGMSRARCRPRWRSRCRTARSTWVCSSPGWRAITRRPWAPPSPRRRAAPPSRSPTRAAPAGSSTGPSRSRSRSRRGRGAVPSRPWTRRS